MIGKEFQRTWKVRILRMQYLRIAIYQVQKIQRKFIFTPAGAILRAANLRGCNLKNANLFKCDLAGADLQVKS